MYQVDNMESLLLSAKLQECYNSTTLAKGKDLTVYCPVIGQAYVARYDDKFWYRAQVIGEGVFMYMPQLENVSFAYGYYLFM